jgi:PAS domain S-box-containing protein
VLLDEDGLHVRHAVVPNLPEAFARSVDGLPIGPRAGSCGTAMYRREPVIVTDILKDPLWEGYHDLVASFGLRACWATPIFSAQAKVLGSFAMYYREPRSPTPTETRLTAIAVHIAGIAIEHERAEAALRASEKRFAVAFRSSPVMLCISTLEDGRFLAVNDPFLRFMEYTREETTGQTSRELNLWVHPEERDQAIQLVKTQGYVRDFESKRLTKSGKIRVVLISMELIELEGQACLLTAAKDITEHKRAERQKVVQYAVTRVLADSASLVAAAPELLRVVGESLNWDRGEFWSVDHEANLIRCIETWHAPTLAASQFSNASRGIVFRPGEGLPGQIWESGESAWIPDIADSSFSRDLVAGVAELRSAFGFPILIEGQSLGVILFFSREILQLDEDLVSMLTSISSQIGQFTERKQAQGALQNFSRRLMEAQEAERQRLSCELHDEIGQLLTAVRMNMEAVQREASALEVSSQIEDSLAVIDEALRQVRNMSLDLRPPHLDDLGLTSALRWYVGCYSKRAGYGAQFIDEQPANQPRLARDLETACFRIAQEGLTNVARHAGAQSVSVKLSRSNGHLELTIEDDGIGFEVGVLGKYSNAIATLGVRGMEERAKAVGGQLSIKSVRGKGTKIRARFPIAG